MREKEKNMLQLQISREEMVDQYGVQDRAMTIGEIVKQTPLKEMTEINRFKITDQEWLSNNPNPTAYELYNQYVIENEVKVSDLADKDDVWYDVVDVDSIYIDDAGEQRNQFKDSETASKLISRANKFKFSRALLWLGYIDIPGNPLNGKYKAQDGGGTLCSASMRGIKELGAIIVRITDEEQLKENFYELAESRATIRGEHKYLRNLANQESLALLQHSVFQKTNTTCLNGKRSGDKSLKHFSLQAQKRLLEWKFVKETETSISGDPVETIADKDLYPTRKATNIVDALNAISTVYRKDTKIIPALGKELTRWYAATNDLVTYNDMVQMLEDYKDGVVTVKNKVRKAGGDEYQIHHDCVTGDIDFETQQSLVDSLRLQDNTETYAMYGVYVFSKLWNIWCKTSGRTKIQPAWLERRCSLEEGKNKHYRYNHKMNYKAEFDKIAKQLEAI